VSKAQREKIEREVAADILEHTKTFECVVCGAPYQEYSKDGRASWGLCGNCPKVERTEEEKRAIKDRMSKLKRYA
jgi:hypothetical protein